MKKIEALGNLLSVGIPNICGECITMCSKCTHLDSQWTKSLSANSRFCAKCIDDMIKDNATADCLIVKKKRRHFSVPACNINMINKMILELL